jgi:hypothetical protein
MSLVSPGQSPRIVRFIMEGNSHAAQYLRRRITPRAQSEDDCFLLFLILPFAAGLVLPASLGVGPTYMIMQISDTK